MKNHNKSPVDYCKYRAKENEIICSVFSMSCAMFHTRIVLTKHAKEHDGVCAYFESDHANSN